MQHCESTKILIIDEKWLKHRGKFVNRMNEYLELIISIRVLDNKYV